jgi:hypothetical protein
MTLIKKIDVDNHFAARRAMRLGRIGPFGAAAIKSAPKRNSAPSTAETLSLKRPSPSTSSASIPIQSDSGRNRLLRPPRSRHP